MDMDMDMEMVARSQEEQAPVPGPAPWLVYPWGERRKHQTFCTIAPHNSQLVEVKSIPQLRGMEVWVCSDGWLLLRETVDRSKVLLLWNPVTLESIMLPRLSSVQAKTIGCKILTSSPAKPGCTILLFEMYRPEIRYCQPGYKKWRVFGCGNGLAGAFGDEYQEINFGDAGCVDGVVYTYMAILMPHMVAFEIDDSNCIRVLNLGLVMPSYRDNSSPNRKAYFVESSGELYIVRIYKGAFHDSQVTDVEVFRLDLSEMAWFKVESLRDRSFFLSRGCCTSCFAEEIGGEGNQIHFIMPEDKHLYTYDLGNGRILTSLPFQSLERPRYPPSWVKPDYSGPNIQMGADQRANVGEAEELEHAEAEQDEEVHAPNFQLDVLESIVRHLTALDYLQFRASSRLFRSAAPPVKWITKSISWDEHFPYPLLVTFRNDKTVFSLVDPKNHDTYFMNIPESLRGKTISCSKDGYLLLVDDDSLSYFNPFAKKQGEFHMSPSALLGLTFTSLPSSSDCMVVQIEGEQNSATINFLRPGIANWWSVTFHTNVDFAPNYNAPVYYDGRFYCLAQKGNMGIFQIMGEDENWQARARLQAPCNNSHHNYLAKSPEGLIAVFLGRNGSWVRVFRLDQIRSAWVRMRNLGNSVIFVSHPSSFVVTAKFSEMENRIYFPRFHRDYIVYYSLETEKFHSSDGSNEEFADFIGTKEQLYSGWIEPRGE